MMKRLGLALVLVMLLVGCGKPAEEAVIPVKIVEVEKIAVVVATPTLAPTLAPTPTEEIEVSLNTLKRIDMLPYYDVSAVVDLDGSPVVYFNLTGATPDDPIQFFCDATREVLGINNRLAIDAGVVFIEVESETGMLCLVITDDMKVICVPFGEG